MRRVIIPNAGIKPEYTYSVDVGFSHNILGKVQYEMTAFNTWFRNAIATAPFTLNGQDSIMYNGIMSAVYASQNVNRAFVRGFNARLKFNFTSKLAIENTISYTYGRFKNLDGTKKPLDHIPPVFGKSGLSFVEKKYNAELYVQYNGWKKIKDYNPDGEDNGQYATPEGMPSWYTINWRSSYKISKNFLLQASVENILDRNYRYFASGFSAPGRNFIVALRAGF